MKSFVDNFKDKRVSIEVLEKMLKVGYQIDTLMQLAFNEWNGEQRYNIQKNSQYSIKLQSSSKCVFILLSSNDDTLKFIKEQIKTSKLKTKVLVFDKTEKFDVFENKVFVDTKEWMNTIISHGINRQILHLQFLRDLEYYYA